MKNTKGFTLIEGLLILVIAGLLGGTGWYVWSAKKKADKSLNTAAQTEIQVDSKKAASQSPVFNKLPDGWFEYKSDENGLRLGYPKEWGELKTNLQTADYQDDTKSLQGRLIISISKKDDFTVVARKYGATIKRSSDDKSWVVVEENPANVDNYKVGETYKTKEEKVNGGVAIDLSYTDEDCTLPRWFLELKDNYAMVSLPELCAVGTETGREPITDANQQAFDKLKTEFLNTITVY